MSRLNKNPMPKYVRIKWNEWDYIASFIEDDEELAIWLKDGSFVGGEIVFELGEHMMVVKDGDTLKLKRQKEKVQFT